MSNLPPRSVNAVCIADNPTLLLAMSGLDKALWKAAQNAEDALMRDDGLMC
jgi:hypothetical protein